MKNKKLKMAPREISKTRKQRINKKSNDKIYKTLTMIFGIATFVFGTTSILLTLYSINLQKRESESRRILRQIESILTTLSDTTTNSDIQDAAQFIQNEIPKDYKFYVHSIGSIADTMEYYERKLKEYEKRIVSSTQPNQLLTTIWSRKGHIAEKPLFFEFLGPSGTIRIAENKPVQIPIKLKIPSEDVYCFSVRILSNRYLLAQYDYLPQGIYNKLEIIDIPSKDTLAVEVGIFLKIDTLNQYPRFFRKEITVVSAGTE